jgi:hypothetical protein
VRDGVQQNADRQRAKRLDSVCLKGGTVREGQSDVRPRASPRRATCTTHTVPTLSGYCAQSACPTVAFRPNTECANPIETPLSTQALSAAQVWLAMGAGPQVRLPAVLQRDLRRGPAARSARRRMAGRSPHLPPLRGSIASK